MKRALITLLAVLVASAIYLYAWPAASLFYVAMVLLHAAAGCIFLVAAVPFLTRLLRETSWAGRVGWLLIVVGGAVGVALIFMGGRRQHWPLLYGHMIASLAGVALLTSAWLSWRTKRGPARRAVGLAGLCLAAVAGLAGGAWWMRTIPWQRAHRIQNPAMAPASMEQEGDGASGPFFPSSAQTADGVKIPSAFFMESQSCQRCHADIYQEWSSSAHHFSSFNNQWYRKSIEYMQGVAGVKPSKWCAGCHDPALLFSGQMDRPIREVVNTPAAHAGLGCTMCHSIAAVKSTMGQGDFTLEYPALHRLADSDNWMARRLHDFVVELNPEPHRRVFLKPFMRNQTAEFCSVCHKVHLDAPVNHYRWTRGFNEYDNWQASGVSGEGARSFYYPAKSQNCADCHMAATASHDAGNVNGLVHSHRFIAANTALPYEEGDAPQLAETERFLRDGQVTVDIFALSPEHALEGNRVGSEGTISRAESAGAGAQTTFAVGEEAEAPAVVAGTAAEEEAAPITAPLNRVDAVVRRDDTVRVDVVVRTKKLGHFFPGGTVDAYDCWLELKATDDAGTVIFWSGALQGQDGPVEPGAHFYRSLLIDAHGNPINKRNAWAARAVVYVRLIAPGAADTVHYRLHIPGDAGKSITLEAKLNYRKFAWWNTQFSFAGMREPQDAHGSATPDFDDGKFEFHYDPAAVSGKRPGIPAVPVVTMTQDEVVLRVAPKGAAALASTVAAKAEDWQRWNDYGIGLLAQGDLKGAQGAFRKILESDTQNADGWVNLARAQIQEGNVVAAQQTLERALKITPDLARAHFIMAKALRSAGRYDDAIVHLRQVLAQYPRDRVAHNELGRVLFLQRKYAEAVKDFQTTLAIDPEDLEANYNLMLCYTGLGQQERARDFQTRYLRFKADESSQSITGAYLRAHPDDNRERQPIHEHTSMAPGTERATHGRGVEESVRRGGAR